MTTWLTTHQVQELLKIDRITVYRMLNDGRLKGVKIGHQWRFSQAEVNRLLGEPIEARPENPENELVQDFPADCVQRVFGIFAGMLAIGALVTTLDGKPLTDIHFGCQFCRHIQSSPSGLQACQASWRKIGHRTGTPFMTCHAGLSYTRATIEFEGQPTALLIAGQFYLNRPNPEEETERLLHLADLHDLPLSPLREAARRIPVLSVGQRKMVQEWTPKVADTVQAILLERSDLMKRLQQIAALSAFHTKPSESSVS